MKTFRTFLLGTVISLASALVVGAQATPEPSPTTAVSTPAVSTPAATLPPASSIAPTVSAVPSAVSVAPVASPQNPNAFADSIKRNARTHSKHGLSINLGDDDDPDLRKIRKTSEQIPEAVVPIVLFSLMAVFGTPIAIVAIILLISWAKARSLHRTVRDMVAKGQPVPPELFASRAGAPLRPWYDLRRGIILLAVGTGIVFFFGASAGWDEGIWALGLIPAIMGAGYIVAWRLAQRQENGFKM